MLTNTITIEYDTPDADDRIRVARVIAVDPADELVCEHCDDADPIIRDRVALELAFDDTFRDSIFVHANHLATDSTFAIVRITNN